jgi:membrane protein YdbS with pleckstrin-like domain
MATNLGMGAPKHPVFENDKKHRLGHRAFTMFLSRHIKFSIFLFALTAAAWYGERYVSATNLPWAAYGVEVLLMLSIAYFVFIFIETYLVYRYYTYLFTEEAFMMTSGYMLRREVAALYHQIQNVNIERSPLDRLIGVSRIVIYMTGDKSSPQNQIVLPGVGKTKAKHVQKELLERARRHFNSAGE